MVKKQYQVNVVTNNSQNMNEIRFAISEKLSPQIFSIDGHMPIFNSSLQFLPISTGVENAL